MPELPEVEIVKRALEGALLSNGVGARIKSLTFNRPNIRVLLPPALPALLAGQRIEQFIRRGKYIICLAENGHGFVLHLGMSGVIKIIPKGEAYTPMKHDHVVFEMEDEGVFGGHVIFNDPRRFGFLIATTRDTWQSEASFKAMGPEPLSNDFSGPTLAARLKGRKSPIKTALLDQKVVAGVGNIYACEALYMAGISPTRISDLVQGVRAERLAKAIVEVLTRAIESGGSSLKDYYHADGSLGYFQHSFKVYDREGDMIEGKHPVKRIVQAGRSTFYCPVKQK